MIRKKIPKRKKQNTGIHLSNDCGEVTAITDRVMHSR